MVSSHVTFALLAPINQIRVTRIACRVGAGLVQEQRVQDHLVIALQEVNMMSLLTHFSVFACNVQ